VILDLSFPSGQSINDGIPDNEYLGQPCDLVYPGVDEFIRLINQVGQGAWMFKRDLKKAYRQFHIDYADIPKLGYQWNNQLFFDRVLPMSLKSSAFICQRITNAVAYCAAQQGFRIINYLDDFAAADTRSGAVAGFYQLAQLLKTLGIRESADKAVPPSQRMAFLGVWFDTVSMTVEVTPDRIADLLDEFQQWQSRSSATLKQVQSLLGKLNFVAKCVRPGRLFMARMLDWLRSFDKGRSRIIPDSFRKDLAWWQRFMTTFNGTRRIPPTIWGPHDAHLATDACLSGLGGTSRTHFLHVQVPHNLCGLSINILEAYAVMVALKLWASQFKGLRISL
jgi:hypothetical protein